MRRLIEHHFAEDNNIGMTKRTVKRIVKKVADKAGISKSVSPHILRHTFSVSYLDRHGFLRLTDKYSHLVHDH